MASMHNRESTSAQVRTGASRRAVGLAMGLAMCAGVAIADTRTQRDTDALALARVCVNEAGWDVTDDCAGILAVLRSRQQRIGLRTIAGTAAVYSTRVFDKSRADRRAWVAWLDDAATPPRGWPRNVDWPTHRAKWRAMVEHAALLLTQHDACGAHHWGGPMDDARAIRAGWAPVDCGETRNHFWRVQ